MSVLFASFPLAISLYLCGEINGFRDGMLAGYDIENLQMVQEKFITHGPNFFDVMTWQYSIIVFCLSLYIIGRFLATKTVNLILSLSFLTAAIVFYWQLLHLKYGIDESAILLYRKWLNTSIRFDWFCLFCVVVLCIVQIYSLITFYRSARKVTHFRTPS